ncbi:hypothetical protein CEXT_801092 [Caerostris extrusa]|uniref:Uncharacterized protein n=1 Tax=Caerostris extrusa TaxID=172846 RepID=A0AAV4NDR0_CAEEX|nr:hypothetical protein CEXT_801092 [Caerostris extrusa]
MLDLLLLLPLFMIGLLNMTFQVSIDEVKDIRRDIYFNYRKYDDDQFLKVQDKVHEFYTRMLDDESENEIMDYRNTSRKRISPTKPQTDVFKGPQCKIPEIQAMHRHCPQCKIPEIQAMHRHCKCRKPRKRCVKIDALKSNVVSVMPECVFLERCEGVCPPTMSCNPTLVEKYTFQ